MTMQTPEYGDETGRRHQWFGAEGRTHYIPAWYMPHEDLGIEVTQGGEPLGFTVKNVLPFRRWAIQADGELLEQHVFAEQYKLYLGAFKTDQHFSDLYESMPNVRAFVQQKFDGNGQIVDLFFEDDGKIEKTEKYTNEGEIAPEWLAKNSAQADKLSKIETLTELLKEGIISQHQYTLKTTAILGDAAAVLVPKEAPKHVSPPRAGPRPRKPMTEEMRQKARENIAKAREKKLANRAAAIAEAVEG